MAPDTPAHSVRATSIWLSASSRPQTKDVMTKPLVVVLLAIAILAIAGCAPVTPNQSSDPAINMPSESSGSPADPMVIPVRFLF